MKPPSELRLDGKARKPVCRRGHPYTEENSTWKTVHKGRYVVRHCKTCNRLDQYERRIREALKESAAKKR